MDNNGMPGRVRQGASANENAFRPDMAREAEDVLRRSGNESLEDYLKNVDTYLRDLNGRLGAPGQAPAGEDDETAPRPEGPEPVPFAGDAPVTGGFTAQRYEPGQASYAPYTDEGPYAPPDGDAYGPYGEYDPGASYDPYGYDDPYAAYAEAAEGYVRNDWQTAVPNPQLYPDLDDPAVTGGAGSRKKRGDAAKRKKKAPKLTKKGKSRFSFLTTALNLGIYAGWTVMYFVCLTVRSLMFTGTQTEMAAQGVENYSVTISSPLFIVLKILVYAMPAVLLLWMRGVLSAEKRNVPQPDKKLLVAAFAADLIAGFIIVFDVLAAKLVFG